MVSKIVEYEVQRQLGLLKIRGELKERNAAEKDVKEEFVDVSSIFEQTKCRVIRKALDQGKRVLAVRLEVCWFAWERACAWDEAWV